MVLNVDAPFLKSFVLSGAIKVAERGREKLRIGLKEPKTVMGELEKCFGRDKPSGAASAQTASLQALEGKWYSDSVRVCKGIPGETEGLLTFKSGHFIGMESDCTIRSSKVNGRFIAIKMICDGEGTRSTASEILEVLNERELKRTVVDQGKRYFFKITRCP